MDDMFTDDIMSFDEKIKLITELSFWRHKFTDLCVKMIILRDKCDAENYNKKDPIIVMCVKAFLESEENYGDLILELRDKVRDMYDRLYECEGDSTIARGIEAELNALRPKIDKLDAHFESMRDRLVSQKKELLQSN